MSDAAITVKDRQGYIGGSDAAAIVGISPWKTPLELYLEKRGEVPIEDISDKGYIYWGNALEALVAGEYSKRTGRNIRRVNSLIRHPEHEFIGAHIDRMVLDGERILEVKTSSRGADWAEGIPPYYYPQVQHYLAVTGREVCDVAVLIGGNDFRIIEVPRDDEAIEGLILLEREFWTRVLAGDPPAPRTAADAARRWANAQKGTVEATEEQARAVAELVVLRQQIRSLQDREAELELKTKNAIADKGEDLTWQGRVLATWRPQVRTSFDPTKVRELLGPRAEEAQKTSTIRVLRIKGE